MRALRIATLAFAPLLAGAGPQVISSSPGVRVDANSVETPADGIARLAIPGGASVELMRGTRIRFDGDTLRLERGTVRLDAGPHATGTTHVATPLANVVFRAVNGYVTTGADEDIVSCVRCRRPQPDNCDSNDFVVRDIARCVSLTDTTVAFVTRAHGITTQAGSEEQFARMVLEQVGAPFRSFSSVQQEGLRMNRDAVAATPDTVGAFRVVERAPGGGDVWFLSTDSAVVEVSDVDPAGTCRWRTRGSGHAAVIAYDQLGRYAVVPVDVAAAAIR